MLKRLSNRGEVYVHDLLAPAAARHGAEIYRKVRIADVVDIELTHLMLGCKHGGPS
jgi:hypothetical protein